MSFRIAQEIRFRREPEAGRLDLSTQHTFLDAVQRLYDAHARSGLRGMVRDYEDAAGFERLEHRPIHLRAIDAHERGVVVGEEERDHVQITHLGRHRIVVVAQNSHDVFHHRLPGALVETFLHALRQRRRVLGVDGATRTHGAREKLGRIAAARAHVEHFHSRTQAGEGQQQLRPSALVGLPVRLGAIRACHEGAVVDAPVSIHARARCEQCGACEYCAPDKLFGFHVRPSAAVSGP